MPFFAPCPESHFAKPHLGQEVKDGCFCKLPSWMWVKYLTQNIPSNYKPKPVIEILKSLPIVSTHIPQKIIVVSQWATTKKPQYFRVFLAERETGNFFYKFKSFLKVKYKKQGSQISITTATIIPFNFIKLPRSINLYIIWTRFKLKPHKNQVSP